MGALSGTPHVVAKAVSTMGLTELTVRLPCTGQQEGSSIPFGDRALEWGGGWRWDVGSSRIRPYSQILYRLGGHVPLFRLYSLLGSVPAV